VTEEQGKESRKTYNLASGGRHNPTKAWNDVEVDDKGGEKRGNVLHQLPAINLSFFACFSLSILPST